MHGVADHVLIVESRPASTAPMLPHAGGAISTQGGLTNQQQGGEVMRSSAARTVQLAVAVLIVTCTPARIVSQDVRAQLPPKLESYLSTVVHPSASQRRLLLGGSPISKLLDTDASKEIAVFGAVWIAAPISRYVGLVKDIERLESGGGFRLTRRISAPPRLEDFAEMHLPAGDVADLRSCKVGDCEVKLGQRGLDAFRMRVDWNAPGARASADEVMRQLAHEYVIGYLEAGNDRLAVYRDGSRPTVVASEFRAMVDEMPELTTHMPDLRRYLLEYPTVILPDAESFLYWQETSFGLKPTIRISHLTIRQGPDDTVVASKMLYASHYFWTALELRVLIPDAVRGPGFWFVTVSRSRADGLSGFTGVLIRRRVRNEARDGALAALRLTKRRVEQGR